MLCVSVVTMFYECMCYFKNGYRFIFKLSRLTMEAGAWPRAANSHPNRQLSLGWCVMRPTPLCAQGLLRAVWRGRGHQEGMLLGGVSEHSCLGAETVSLRTCRRPPVMATVRVTAGQLQCECKSSPQVCRPQEQGPESQGFPPGDGLPEPLLDFSRLWPPVGRDDRTKGAQEWGESQAVAPGPPCTSLGPRTSPLTL